MSNSYPPSRFILVCGYLFKDSRQYAPVVCKSAAFHTYRIWNVWIEHISFRKYFNFTHLILNLENELLMTPTSCFHFLSYFTSFIPKLMHFLYNKSEEWTTWTNFHVFILHFPWILSKLPTKKIKIFLSLFPSNASNLYRARILWSI